MVRIGRVGVRRFLIGGVAAFVLVATSAAVAADSGWVIQKTPTPVGGGGLRAVSCTSASACTAVGSYTNSASTGVALVERWNGTKWVVQKAPTPAGGTDSSLSGVSCTSANVCTAVGDYINSANTDMTLAERWNGTKWVILKTPNPAGAIGSGLDAVSCTSASACTAVGNYESSSGAELTLAERWNGTKWVIQKTPNITVSGEILLSGVSCTSASACTAVGSYDTGTVAEHWNGTKWVIQKTPYPPGAAGDDVELRAVSCTSASACTAVGVYLSSAGPVVTLTERWNGIKWAIQKTPNPSSAAELDGVSCTSGSACTAVGDYVNSAGSDVTLAEHWNGTKWVIEKTPNPAGATQSVLGGVSCTSGRACTAVGESGGSDTEFMTLAERHS